MTPQQSSTRQDVSTAILEDSFHEGSPRVRRWVEKGRHYQLRSLAVKPEDIFNLEDLKLDESKSMVLPPTEVDRYPPIQR